MAEALTPKSIQHLGHLARLELTAEEQQRFATQLSGVVEYIDQLSAVATEGVDVLKGVSGLHNVLAADLPRAEDDLAHMDYHAAIGAAPAQEADFILVRAVL